MSSNIPTTVAADIPIKSPKLPPTSEHGGISFYGCDPIFDIFVTKEISTFGEYFFTMKFLTIQNCIILQ